MKKKIIHVNQLNIRHNLKHEDDKPVVTVKYKRTNFYGHSVFIDGPSKIIYPEKPLSCGARVWIETNAKVIVYDRGGKIVGELDAN